MIFFNDLENFSSNIAIITEHSEHISYENLLNLADDIGNNIRNRSLIFIVCKNSYHSLAGYIGFLRAKAVVGLINDSMDAFLLKDLLDSYKPEFVFLPSDKVDININWTKVNSYDSYTLLKTDYIINYTLYPDLALLMTTSGSTGSQKFVRQSYKNIDSNTDSISKYLEIKSTDRPISTMPMSYTFMLSIINSHLYKGASIVLTEATLMEKRFWQLIKFLHVTTFSGVPYTYEMLKKLRFEKMDLPSLQYLTQAGGKLSLDLSKEFAEVCWKKGIKFFVMYGQTEGTARMSYLPWNYSRSKAGSIGVAIPGGQFWLVDNEGNEIPKAETMGELVYKGDNVTLGYAENCFDLNKGDENNGILRTGDLAKLDEDGFYYITGRKKRFLKMYGNRVNLNEVEELIKAKGFDCVCAGVDDNMKIFITELEHKERIRNYVTECTGINRSGFTIIHISEIPRNESGKVLYKALSEYDNKENYV